MILSSPDQLSYKPSRIISLVPSQTELLHWLGLEAETIGITKFCIHPDPWFRNKTRIGGTKKVNIEKVISLQPDLIIANREENIKEQVEMLAKDMPVWVTDVNDLDDAYTMINDIGELTGAVPAAKSLVKKLKDEFDQFLKEKPVNRFIPAAYLIWKGPYMSVGSDSFISNMMQLAGFRNIFGDKLRYPEISLEDIRIRKAELVLLSSEPYPFKQKDVDELSGQLPGMKILLVDGEMFSWYGSRLLHAPIYFKKLINQIEV